MLNILNLFLRPSKKISDCSHCIEIEDHYPYNLEKRYGKIKGAHSGIKSILEANTNSYIHMLKDISSYNHFFKEISYEKANAYDPFWNNGFFPFLDIATLFGVLGKLQPKTYFEIGSGNSTKVAHFAKKKLGLSTKICSLDPFPRAEIDQLCDDIIRKPLEECELDFIFELEAGDILFFDGTHRVLQNSDNQVLFFEIIPKLNPGVYIHLHDISWPHDYPEQWIKRYYNEQYVLGSMLLYAPDMFKVIMPCAFISMYIDYFRFYNEIWNRRGFENIEKHGASFWFTKLYSNEAMLIS